MILVAYKSNAERMFEAKAKKAMELQNPALMQEVGEQWDAYLKLVSPWTDEYIESMNPQSVAAQGGTT
jgi:hypothetical protein